MSETTPARNPFQSVADAMSEAAEAAGVGDSDPKGHIDTMIPATSGILNHLAYRAGYAVSYGTVYPSILLARAIPSDNAMVHGLVDGARAAREAVFGDVTGSASAAPEPA